VTTNTSQPSALCRRTMLWIAEDFPANMGPRIRGDGFSRGGSCVWDSDNENSRSAVLGFDLYASRYHDLFVLYHENTTAEDVRCLLQRAPLTVGRICVFLRIVSLQTTYAFAFRIHQISFYSTIKTRNIPNNGIPHMFACSSSC